MKLSFLIDRALYYGKRPQEALAIIRAVMNRGAIRKSEWFDEQWMLKTVPHYAANGLDPAIAYQLFSSCGSAWASASFVDDEYRALHPDCPRRMPALLHFEKHGKNRGYAISYADSKMNGGRTSGIVSHYKFDIDEFRKDQESLAARLKMRIDSGLPVRVVFLVFSNSMFTARPLLDKMLRDKRFAPQIAVIPDLRWKYVDVKGRMSSCMAELGEKYPDELFIPVEQNADGSWPDVLVDVDVVCYPTPYDMSDFHYNPHWAVNGDFLAVLINYGLYFSEPTTTEMFSRHDYAYFWKVFLEHKMLVEDYARLSITGGSNATLVGYVKMDELARTVGNSVSMTRKRVLVCPHHSLPNGYNSNSALSTFLKYFEYYQTMPKRFPEIDFVFRPHPMLFQLLAEPGFWGREKTDGYIRELKANCNVEWSLEGEYLARFNDVDGAIMDLTSLLPEFLYTGKPCCGLLLEHGILEKRFTQFGQACFRQTYLAYSPEEIDSFLNSVVLSGNDPMRRSRNEFRLSLMVNHPDVSDVIVKTMLSF